MTLTVILLLQSLLMSSLICLSASSSFTTTPSAFDQMYDGGKAHKAMRNELMQLCRQARKGEKAVWTHATRCSGMDSKSFRFWVMSLKKQHSGAASMAQWKKTCFETKIRDLHEPPVCMAYAYMLVPFNIGAVKGPAKCLNRSRAAIPAIHPRAKSYDLKVFAVETKPSTKKHCNLVRSACGAGIELDLLAADREEAIIASEKLRIIAEYIRAIPKNKRHKTIVLNVDSRDVILQATKDQLVSKLLNTGHGMIFGTEGNCWPATYFPANLIMGSFTEREPAKGLSRFSSYYICDKLYPSGTSKRWLNAGGFLAFADVALEAIDPLLNIPEDFRNSYPHTDQFYFHQTFLSGRYNVSLDTCGEIFFNFLAPEDYEEDFQSHPSGEGLALLYSKGPFRNTWGQLYAKPVENSDSQLAYVWAQRENDDVPAVLHFNGVKKDQFWRLATEYGGVAEPCKLWLNRFEASMWKSADSRASEGCPNSRNLFSHCADTTREIQSCKFNMTSMTKDEARLGFWIELSPVRFLSSLPWEAHQSLAKASFAAVNAIGLEDWLRFVGDGGEFTSAVSPVHPNVRKMLIVTNKIRVKNPMLGQIISFLPLLLLCLISMLFVTKNEACGKIHQFRKKYLSSMSWLNFKAPHWSSTRSKIVSKCSN